MKVRNGIEMSDAQMTNLDRADLKTSVCVHSDGKTEQPVKNRIGEVSEYGVPRHGHLLQQRRGWICTLLRASLAPQTFLTDDVGSRLGAGQYRRKQDALAPGVYTQTPQHAYCRRLSFPTKVHQRCDFALRQRVRITRR